MAARQNITKRQFGKLTAESIHSYTYYPSGGKNEKWLCHCECGKNVVVSRKNLLNGNTSSCGCSRSLSKTTHGGKGTRLYNTWCSMKDRCYSQNNKSYGYYGARGIRVDQQWLKDFAAFRDWSLANGYKDNLTLDRIDVDGPYTPNNCRWVDMRMQANNRRNSIYITLNGETHTCSEWSRITGINYDTINNRYHAGMTPEEILNDCKYKTGPKSST